MPLGKPDFSARLRSSYEKLSSSARSLNAGTDELTKLGTSFDAALKKLNLGIDAWIEMACGSNEMGTRSYYDQLGYAKISGKWAVGIRQVERDEHSGDEEVTQEWFFADAPRELRISAVNRMPELIQKLQEEAQRTSERINDTLENARAVLMALNEIGEPEVKK
jgi:hypothetical protein